MKTTMKPYYLIIPVLALLAACKESTTTAAGHGPAPVAATPGAALGKILLTAPGDQVQSIHAARATAKPGDEITLSGRIMGSKDPFVSGRAAFILGDPEVLTPCNAVPGDDCKTPWDVCCDSPEDKKRGTATIQVLGADGRVLKEAIEGVGGIEKLAALTVTGKVAEGSSADALVVNASAIRVGK